MALRTDGSVSAGGFRAVVRWTYGPQQGCGGLFNLTDGSKTITSLDVDGDGSYEPELNCQWTVVAPPGKVVKLRFTRFQLEMRQNDTHRECWDYVEIRNGEGPFSPQIGLFCGSIVPPDFHSSHSFLWIKFFSDDLNSAAGFSAVATAEDPLCGSLLPLNATTEEQIIESPGFGSDYPRGITCRWTVAAPTLTDRVSLRVITMELENSTRCTKDRLELADVGGRAPVSQDASGLVVLSSDRSRTTDYLWRTVGGGAGLTPPQNLLRQHATYCGATVPHEFISTGDRFVVNQCVSNPPCSATVTFVSDASVTAAGFRLAYQAAPCSRTYTAPHGRVLSPAWPSRVPRNTSCTFTIASPSGSFISLYFRYFNIAGSQNCTSNYLEVPTLPRPDECPQVRDGPAETAPLLTRLCGRAVPATLSSR
jgi:cubilin